jgi:hypothetical protein
MPYDKRCRDDYIDDATIFYKDKSFEKHENIDFCSWTCFVDWLMSLRHRPEYSFISLPYLTANWRLKELQDAIRSYKDA